MFNVLTDINWVAFGLVVGIGYLTAMTYQIAINPSFPALCSTAPSTRPTSSSPV